MRKTQLEKFSSIVEANGKQLVNENRTFYHGQQAVYNLELEDYTLKLGFDIETGKMSQGYFIEYKNGGGTVATSTFTKMCKMFEPKKSYGEVKWVEGDKPEVGVGATLHLYSDSYAFTVVDVINESKIVVRRCKATLKDGWKPDMQAGGFSAHTSNNASQEYTYEDDLEAVGVAYTLRNNGGWYAEGESSKGSRLVLGYRARFYDYNF